MAHNLPPKICVICGKSYKPTSNTQKVCGKECKKIFRKLHPDKRTIKPKDEPRPKKHKESELARISRLAREKGMTYGQYMAEQYKKVRM